MSQELGLRYGMNPHQAPARIYVTDGELPLSVLNGAPGFINLLDALNAWQLVREADAATGLPAATSFKHTAPAGVGLGLPLSPELAQACRVDDLELSPLADAYARARGADRLASFGDFAAFSRTVDLPAARILSREVSDGVIAPGYDADALAVLQRKKAGKYLVLQIDPDWTPPATERREVFGITFEQPRNTATVTLGETVTRKTEISEAARLDLLLAAVTLKYTPSNSIVLAVDGQAIGIGAGQQSRILCTRIACQKAELWWLRQHPRALSLQYEAGVSRSERDNAVEAWLRDEPTTALVNPPVSLTEAERGHWIKLLQRVALASDGLIPFRDNIDRAAQTGVRYVWQPGGSIRLNEVQAAADEHGMVMTYSGLRLFHH
ncbi:MAG: phosphoribosylaminoimidazolecarboxamide formyltransferase [Chloroflexi bacterium]|nr:phosphoribosylaminoimidazolecarboxamide formyltransferase [Chloroflexota bacterium]